MGGTTLHAGIVSGPVVYNYTSVNCLKICYHGRQ